MKFYAYRLEGGGRAALRARGLAALVPETNQHRLQRQEAIDGADSLYSLVGEVLRPELISEDDIQSTRQFSPSFYLHAQLIQRLCSIRDEWSR